MSLLLLFTFASQEPPASVPEFREFRGSTLFAVDAQTEQRYPTATIPYRPNAICYEWVLFFATEDRTVPVRETLELPAAPASWGDAPAQGARIESDGRRAVTVFSDSLADGQINRRWCLGEGDPLGPYLIRVQVGERLVEEIRFEVVPLAR